MALPLIPQDYANHAVYGAAVYLVAALIGTAAGVGSPKEFALAVTVAVGAIKEGADYLMNRKAIKTGLTASHGVDWWDFGATAFGGFACYAAASF